MMEGEELSSVPATLYPSGKNASYIKTRKEKKQKQNQVMREAEKRTQESLDRLQLNVENSNPNHKS